MSEGRRDLVLATAEDAAADFCYYDRKEDEDLPQEALKEAIDSGVVTIDEIVGAFRKVLVEAFGEP